MPNITPDLVIKRHDTFPALKPFLEQLNQETKELEPIDFKSATASKALLKKINPETGVVEGSTITISPLHAWGGGALTNSTATKKGQVEIGWTAESTGTLGLFKIECEFEFGSGNIQTVPNEGWRTIEVIEDLETA